MTASEPSGRRPHGLVPMRGRSPHEAHRVASPLELLYDLTIVVAFSIAGSQLAHAVANGHLWQGLAGFAFVMFAIIWAWISFSWFASAYDTDDWGMRLATLVQMIGVIVLSLGLPAVFHGMETWHLDNRVMVVGYVIMRCAMVHLWVRAAAGDPSRRRVLLGNAGVLVLAQVAWTLLAFTHPPTVVLVVGFVLAYFLEMGAPQINEHRAGTSPPWHPHHMAERYSLLVIITLGEVILGTTTAVESVVGAQGWSVEAALVAFAGVSIAFGLWWAYFAIPFGEVLEVRPQRGWSFGLGHIPLFASTAAIGAGLHVAAYYVAGESTLGEGGTILAVAVPLAAFMAVFFGLVLTLMPGYDSLHTVMLALMLAAVVLAAVLGFTQAPLGLSLIVLALAPWITVVGYELRGHRHLADVLDRLRAESTVERA